MAVQISLFVYSSLFLDLLQISVAAKPYCPPSSCGIITNITDPFRLNTDPSYCGDPRAELACENNVTFLYLNSHKYFVRAINHAFVRVVDASIDNHTCSFPNTPAYPHTFSTIQSDHPYSIYANPTPINLMSCSHPLENSSLYTDVTHCNPSSSRFTYIRIGRMRASDVTQACIIDATVWASWDFKDSKNVSLEEIHRSLLYGFELNFCNWCRNSWSWTRWDGFMYLFYIILRKPFRILLLILVLSGAVVYPLMSLIVAAIILFLLTFIVYLVYSALRYAATFVLIYDALPGFFYDDLTELITNIMFLFGPRFIISLLLVWLLIYKFRRRHLSKYDTIEKFLQSDNKLVPIRYSYSDIKKMTKNFQNKLGEGGYGSVYKGKLRSGGYVAVKMLGKSGANDQDFMNEIGTIGRIHHVNIVTLVGYCVEGSKRALILDFMPNGSLEKYIFNKDKRNGLHWDIKFGIVVGVARGIEYLHKGCDIQILHIDIKPHNILLDDKFIPKISDFGLAKFCSTDKNTLTLTAARGTIGYVAPELINRGIGRVSHKADVYSFGMLLVEMVGLKRDLKEKNDDSTKYFPDWIYDCFNQGKDIKIGSIDESDDNYDNESTRKLVRKMIIVALWCTQMNPDDRPSINKVLEMLEGEVECLQIPHRPLVSTNILNVDGTSFASSTYGDSVPLLNNGSNVEIIVEDFRTLP